MRLKRGTKKRVIKKDDQLLGPIAMRNYRLWLLRDLYDDRYSTISAWLRGELRDKGRSAQELAAELKVTVYDIERWAVRIGLAATYAEKVKAAKAEAAEAAEAVKEKTWGLKYLSIIPCKKDIGHVINGRTRRYVTTKRCVLCVIELNIRMKGEEVNVEKMRYPRL